ncbi:hypothetical protein GCM10027440_53380 [Nocardiopsis coralliicola]
MMMRARAVHGRPPPPGVHVKLYADRPVRLCVQVAADLLLIAWTLFWWSTATGVHASVDGLGDSGALMAAAGDDVDEHMSAAADTVRDVPVAGDALSVPFTSVGEAGTSLSDAGRSFQDSVAEVALAAGILAFVLPALIAVLLWVPTRGRWIRAASAAVRLDALGTGARDRLLALRALASVRPSKLLAAGGDPAAAWQQGDADAIRTLAGLERHRLGLRAPRPEP